MVPPPPPLAAIWFFSETLENVWQTACRGRVALGSTLRINGRRLASTWTASQITSEAIPHIEIIAAEAAEEFGVTIHLVNEPRRNVFEAAGVKLACDSTRVVWIVLQEADALSPLLQTK